MAMFRTSPPNLSRSLFGMNIVTAARATALALKERAPRVTMVLGGPGLAREVRDEGLRVVAPTKHGLAAEPDALLVGVDFSLDYGRLSIASMVARGGAYFIATNRDPVFPLPDGLHAGAGSIVAAGARSAGVGGGRSRGGPGVQPGGSRRGDGW